MVNACHPLDPNSIYRDPVRVEIVELRLEHTNGCDGNDEDINQAITRRAGLKCSNTLLHHLSKEVRAGWYSTKLTLPRMDIVKQLKARQSICGTAP